MSLYTIADLHLSEAVAKPMDIFGGAWENYREKIIKNFQKTLSPDDILVVVGDVSWGINLNEALPDFKLLSSLPGKKLIIKGNHDLWWETVTKMKRFLFESGISNIDFIYNNCFLYGGTALCGTRGWFFEEDKNGHNEKIFKRELLRLEASLKAARGMHADRIFAFLHYPPLCSNYRCTEILSLMRQYGVSKCFYGHLHGISQRQAYEGSIGGIEFRFVSADHINFTPFRVIL